MVRSSASLLRSQFTTLNNLSLVSDCTHLEEKPTAPSLLFILVAFTLSFSSTWLCFLLTLSALAPCFAVADSFLSSSFPISLEIVGCFKSGTASRLTDILPPPQLGLSETVANTPGESSPLPTALFFNLSTMADKEFFLPLHDGKLNMLLTESAQRTALGVDEAGRGDFSGSAALRLSVPVTTDLLPLVSWLGSE